MAGPYIFPTAETSKQWQQDVKAAGGFVTVIPRGPAAGTYAARFPNVDGLPSGSYTYTIAPVAVIMWQYGQIAEDEAYRIYDDAAQWIRDAGSAVVDSIAEALAAAGKAAGKAAGGVFEGFWWLLVPAAVLAAYLYLPEPKRKRRR